MSDNTDNYRLKIAERTLTKRVTINGEYFLIFSLSYSESKDDVDPEDYENRFELYYEVSDSIVLSTKIHESIEASALLEIYRRAKAGNSYCPVQLAESPVCELNTLFTGSPHPITVYIPLAGEYSMSDLVIEFVETFFDEETLLRALNNSSFINTKPVTGIN